MNYQDDLNKTRSNPWHQPTTFPAQWERASQEQRERDRFTSSLGSSHSAPQPYDRGKNDVAICALLVAVAVTWSAKRLCSWGWETNWQALAITAIVTIVISRIYFQRHLLLARRIVVGLALVIVAIIAFSIWSLSRH